MRNQNTEYGTFIVAGKNLENRGIPNSVNNSAHISVSALSYAFKRQLLKLTSSPVKGKNKQTNK